MASPTSVAVIGSGAAGLASCRAFAKLFSSAGLRLDVFESGDNVGGVWDYKGDPQKPMYKGLRTNLPKELMGFREFAFRADVDDDSYVAHRTVQSYLEDYAEVFELKNYIRFNTAVKRLSFVEDELEVARSDPLKYPRLRVEYANTDGTTKSEVYDHVVVANGHYSAPSIPLQLQELHDEFKGTCMHSIAYDNPLDRGHDDRQLYVGKTVLCVGGRASGSDIAREISAVAKKVYVSDSSTGLAENNVESCAKTAGLGPDQASIFLEDGSTLKDVDVVIFCTGYDYNFPFLDGSNCEVSFSTGERRVGPLYQQLFHAANPTLSFIGLPHSVVPFPLFEFQAEAVAKAAMEKFKGALPPRDERMRAAKEQFDSGGPPGRDRVVDTHYLGDYQWDYCRDMAKIGGVYNDAVESYISTNEQIYNLAGSERKSCPLGGVDVYRRTRFVRDGESWQKVKVPAAK